MATVSLQVILHVILAHLNSFVESVCINDPSTSMISDEINRLEWMDLTEHDIINVTQSAFISHQSCDNLFIENNTPYNHRTMCPWDYVRDYDENRFPPVLYVAKCKCRTCSQHGHFQCRPVLYSMPVLIKQCKHGVMQWMRKTHLVSVACACVRPEVRLVRKRLSSILNIDLNYFDIF